MLKLIGLGLLVCIGGAVAFAIYAAWRITKMGQAMGRRGYADGSQTDQHGYITTTGTTIHDPDLYRAETPQYMDDARDPSNLGGAAGDSIGASAGESVLDFGSSDTGSSDSGSSDSGSGDSGGGDAGGGSSD